MSKLSELKGKGNIVKLSNDVEIEIKPMTLDDEITIADLQEEKKYLKAVAYLVKSTLKRAIPDATDEEIENLNKEDLKLITNSVMEINGLVSKNEKAMKDSPQN